MPLDRSNAIPNISDPNIVLGPRKRRPTERALGNGDPLACKKARRDQVAATVTVSNADACVDNRSPTLSSMPPPTHLTLAVPHGKKTIDNAEHTNDRTSGGAQPAQKNKVIMVESSDEDGNNDVGDKGATTDEDDAAELGMCSTTLVNVF